MNRDLLGALADQLIPAGSGMPSASEAGVAGEYLDAVLAARPDLADPLWSRPWSRSTGSHRESAIAQLRDTDPEGWGVLTAVVPGAYFLNPEIRAAIGYPGLEARPIDPGRPARLPGGRAARFRDRARTRLPAHP